MFWNQIGIGCKADMINNRSRSGIRIRFRRSRCGFGVAIFSKTRSRIRSSISWIN